MRATSFPAFVWRFLLLLVLVFAGSLPAHASRTLLVVSDRSAPTLVAGAHQLASQEQHENVVQIRSLSQLVQHTDAELQDLILDADQMALVAVYGETVDRLLALSYPRKQFRVVIHSDHRLWPLQHDSQGAVFTGPAPDAVTSDKTFFVSNDALRRSQAQWPRYADWLQARAYWINRSVNNASHLIAWLATNGRAAPVFEEVKPVRIVLHKDGQGEWLDAAELPSRLHADRPVVWLLDHDSGDLAGEWVLHQRFCKSLQAQYNAQCVSVLAAWGQPSVDAVQHIVAMSDTLKSQLVVAVQDFVIGGGDGRERVNELLASLDVPVLKGLRLSDVTARDYAFSAAGIPADTVHYRVAMPELQGVSQPMVLAMAAIGQVDPLTGAEVSRSEPQAAAIEHVVNRVGRWLRLQTLPNRDKRVAIVYYNHPPGRHNIGADNLNVPESLLEILRGLKAQGYDTGELPRDVNALLDLLQARGVNLPEDRKALAGMHREVNTVSTADYQTWFQTLPASVQAEMRNGPLALLKVRFREGVAHAHSLPAGSERQAFVKKLSDSVHNTATDIHHALDGLRHPARERALALLEQLESSYVQQLNRVSAGESISSAQQQQADELLDALLALKIEGLRGWGEAPGKVMVWQGDMLIPGLQFGKVFVGPQPPRGWEINEELLHANLSFPPPHQYLGFYYFLKHQFKADALVHLGRHSTYEFLPRRSVGLGGDDYPSIIAGDLPGIYPYIVDGVGEGIQAKRRGLAVMVDHLTPPLAATELYDDLLELRQLIESAEAASDTATRTRAVSTLRRRIDEMGLRDELIASMDEELQVRGVGFDGVDEEFLLHEVGHYLTNIQEDFMPLGLHVFGQAWSESAVATMLNSMAQGLADAERAQKTVQWKNDLRASPAAEMDALLAGLSGRFVLPGKGNDPLRTPEALPTGRNFFALDGSLLPTRVGYALGSDLAEQVLRGEQPVIEGLEAGERNKQGLILWASDAVRDEGAMIAFGMRLLGVQPVWNSRGILKGLERLPLSEQQPQRLDVVFNTSGLFRDLYGEHLVLLDKASLMALDASADLIVERYPALIPMLNAALAPLAEWRQGGRDSLANNLVASNWVNEARTLLQNFPDRDPQQLGREASLRVFGIAPGAYGAGINRLAERSSAWDDASQLSDVFIKRMGHVYGAELSGESAQPLFKRQLSGISQTWLGRASNLYGLMDNNDAFDYLGGLNLAVESVSGRRPASSVIDHSRPEKATIDSLETALLSELRGRFLNPQWIKPLMDEGYAGARTMGSEFFEYLWGWQVTSPDIIRDQVWDAVKAVYVDDSLDLKLDEFLNEGHNQSVQTNMLAILLVAVDKGYWSADDATQRQLAEQLVANILSSGLPGSGHTHPDHPVFERTKSLVDTATADALEAVLSQSRLEREVVGDDAVRITELSQASDRQQDSSDTQSDSAAPSAWSLWVLAGLTVFLLVAGFLRSRRVV